MEISRRVVKYDFCNGAEKCLSARIVSLYTGFDATVGKNGQRLLYQRMLTAIFNTYSPPPRPWPSIVVSPHTLFFFDSRSLVPAGGTADKER